MCRGICYFGSGRKRIIKKEMRENTKETGKHPRNGETLIFPGKLLKKWENPDSSVFQSNSPSFFARGCLPFVTRSFLLRKTPCKNSENHS